MHSLNRRTACILVTFCVRVKSACFDGAHFAVYTERLTALTLQVGHPARSSSFIKRDILLCCAVTPLSSKMRRAIGSGGQETIFNSQKWYSETHKESVTSIFEDEIWIWGLLTHRKASSFLEAISFIFDHICRISYLQQRTFESTIQQCSERHILNLRDNCNN